jgi:RHS repeat-associated protein
VVVDRNNNLRWRWISEPFGTTAAETNPAGLGVFTQNLRFPGQYFDSESGLHYNYHRFYDPTAGGRYTTPDPLGLDGGDLSLYAYSSANPLSYIDPLGLTSREMENPLLPFGDGASGGGNFRGGGGWCPPAARSSGVTANRGATGAESVVNGFKLNKALGSQAQMGEAGTTMAGVGAACRSAMRRELPGSTVAMLLIG